MTRIPNIFSAGLWGFCLVFLFLGNGCKSDLSGSTIDLLLIEGHKQFAGKNYVKSKTSYTYLLEKNPQSETRAQGILGLADSHYKLLEFEEASIEYQKFLNLHPADDEAPRVLFFIGMCNFRQMLTLDRDQTKTLDAERNFKIFLERYPDHILSDTAKKNLQTCQKNYANHLFYIGKYYYRTEAYHSAINRMKELLEKYPDETFVPEALFYLADSLYKEESYEKSIRAFDSLIKLFPRSEFAKMAKERKNEIGLN